MPQTNPYNSTTQHPPHEKKERTGWRHSLIVFLILATLGIAVYSNIFHSPFIYDSVLNISQNPHIRMDKISWERIAQIRHSSSPRPLSNFSFAINYFFHHYHLPGYYLINILIHIFNAFLVFLVARQTIRLIHHQNHFIPICVALLWLVHPLHTQSVTYLVQRMNALATLFYLLSLVFFVAARKNQQTPSRRRFTYPPLLFLISGLCGLCGLAAKPIVASLPATIFIYEWFFFQHLQCAWLKQRFSWVIGGLTIITAIAVIYLGVNPVDHLLGGYDRRYFTLVERLLTEPGIVIYYLSLLIFPSPSRLTLLYNFPLATSFTGHYLTSLSFLTLLVMIGGAVVISRKDRLTGFAIIWFLINLVIESSVLGLQLAFEHRTYLPSVFPIMAIVALLFRYLRSVTLRVILLGLIMILFSAWTWQRNITWQDKIEFWHDCAAKTPLRADVHNNLGQVLMEQNHLDQAIFHFKRAIQLDPELSSAYTNMGVALSKNDKTKVALKYHQKALAMAPENPHARYNLAMALQSIGETDRSIKQLEKTLSINPYFSPAAFKLGLAWQEKGDHRKALAYFQKARQLDPGNSMIYNNAGICLQALGDTKPAIRLYQQGLKIDKTDFRLHNSLGLALLSQGDLKQAETRFKTAIQLNPEMAEPYNNLGLIAQQKKDINQARHHFEQALRHNPDFFQAHLNLADLWLQQKKPLKALPHLEQALKTDPQNLSALNRMAKALADCEKYDQAMAVLEKMAALSPDNPTIAYNQACLHARQGQNQQAVKTLQEAIQKGYDNWSHLQYDNDLDKIRNTGSFKILMEKIRPPASMDKPTP